MSPTPGPLDLNALVAHTADGVCATAPDGEIILWNRSAERVLGYPARDVIGTPCCTVFVGQDPAGNRLCYQGCHGTLPVGRGEPVQNFDMATRTKAGKRVWLNVSILMVSGRDPTRSTTFHLFRDVTALRETRTPAHERLTEPASANQPDFGAVNGLTRREVEILCLMAGGASTRAMAERLHVSPATVRNHVQNILGKLGAHSRLEAAAYATRRGLLRGP